jgi:hypothetical protein
MTLARPLADAGEDRNAVVGLDGGPDQLATSTVLPTGAEYRRLAAPGERRRQIDDLIPVSTHCAANLSCEWGRRLVDRPPLHLGC